MWIKKGLIIEPSKTLWWNQSHGMLPTVQHYKDDEYKVFYSGRDKNNISHIGYSVIKIEGDKIRERYKMLNPILSPGKRGCFDDNGVTPSYALEDKLYYIGWNSGTTTTRMSLIMGMATKENASSGKGDVYSRVSKAPLMPRTDKEPFGICTAPYVMKYQGMYHMWYVSGNGWINKDLPEYDIKYAISQNGYCWNRDGIVSLHLEEGETALARPCVIRKGDIFEMFFSYKDPAIGYRIGYATSKDGIRFRRDLDSPYCLSVSDSGWESEMVEYGFVLSHKDKKFILYNGNQYGYGGIGYAVWR